jgi:hypothetical protein
MTLSRGLARLLIAVGWALFLWGIVWLVVAVPAVCFIVLGIVIAMTAEDWLQALRALYG